MGVKLAKVRDLVEFTLILDNLILKNLKYLFYFFISTSFACTFPFKEKKNKRENKSSPL